MVRAVWTCSSPRAAGPIHEALNAHRARPLAYTTIQAVMARLAVKGVLVRTLMGRGDLNEAAAPSATGLDVRRLLRDFGEEAIIPFMEGVRAEPRLRALLEESWVEEVV